MLPCVAGGALVGHLGDEAVGGTVRAEGREGADEMDRLGIESRGGSCRRKRREREGRGMGKVGGKVRGMRGGGERWCSPVAMVLACSSRRACSAVCRMSVSCVSPGGLWKRCVCVCVFGCEVLSCGDVRAADVCVSSTQGEGSRHGWAATCAADAHPRG